MYRQVNRYNKFGNVKQTYDGYSYMSKAEADYAMELDLRLKAKDIKFWERQFKVAITNPKSDKHICNYFLDFIIQHNDDSYELIEVKGYPTSTWMLKKKLLEVLWLPENPNYRYTVINHKSGWGKRK